MQERELIKEGILGDKEEDVKQQQLRGRTRFIRPPTNMNPDNTGSSDINITNNNTANTNTSNNSVSSNTNSQPPALRCPRCDSPNTKFCYYNNYSLLQPRYFCKSCRRYWTKGGALRNVPVGGGCRKNKRITTRPRIGGTSDLILPSSSNTFLSHAHLADHPPPPFSSFGDDALNATRPAASFSLLNPPHDPAPISNLLSFNLPCNDALMRDNSLLNQPFFLPTPIPSGSHDPHSPSAGLFSRQLASYLPSSLASQYLSNVGSLSSHNLQGFNHDCSYSNAASDQQPLMHHSSFSNSINLVPTTTGMDVPTTPGGPASTVVHHDCSNMAFKAFSLPFDNLSTGDHDDQRWATTKITPHEQQLLTDRGLHNISNAAIENQGSTQDGPSRLFGQLRSRAVQFPKVEEGWPSKQHGQETTSSDAVNAEGNQAGNTYWTAGGWNDMSGYNTSADHPFM